MVWKAALSMLVYGLAMITIGVITFAVAPPPQVKAITGLAIPGAIGAAMIVCAVLAMRIDSSRRLGMVGIHVGLILPLVAALGSGFMLAKGLGGAREAREHVKALNDALRANQRATIVSIGEEGAATDTLQAQGDLVVPAETGIRPTGYKVMAQTAVVTLSALGFVSLILHRPDPPARRPASKPIDGA